MKTSLPALIAVLFLAVLLPACKQKNLVYSEEFFFGDWYTVKGDVEAFSFLKDGRSYIFTGTRGRLPVAYGTWKIEKDKFVMAMDNGTVTTYNFAVSNDTLIFNEGEEIYTRTAPLEIKYPEMRILKALSGDLSSLKFSTPQPADLTREYRIDSTQTSQSYSLKGYSISSGSTLSLNVIEEISDYLKDYGFEPDTIDITSFCNGFRDDNQIVTICTSPYSEAKNDSVYILVTSALIVK